MTHTKPVVYAMAILLIVFVTTFSYGGCGDKSKSGSSGATLRIVNNAGYDVRVSVTKDLYGSSQILGDVAAYTTKDFGVPSGNYDTILIFRPYTETSKVQYNVGVYGMKTITFP